jgi:hypothetical protein
MPHNHVMTRNSHKLRENLQSAPSSIYRGKMESTSANGALDEMNYEMYDPRTGANRGANTCLHCDFLQQAKPKKERHLFFLPAVGTREKVKGACKRLLLLCHSLASMLECPEHLRSTVVCASVSSSPHLSQCGLFWQVGSRTPRPACRRGSVELPTAACRWYLRDIRSDPCRGVATIA